MKVAILVEDQYQVLEVWYPYLRLREAGIETVLVGTGSKRSYGSKEGYPADVSLSIDQVHAKDFDGVIVPGGWAPDILRRYDKVNQFVKAMDAAKKCVAGICHAGWMLVSAGVLKGKRATCFSAIKDDIVNAGATYLDKEVVVDGNLITSRTPFDLPAFCKAIIGFLQKK